MNFNFGEVLSRAWQIIWKHKVLWIFGILASCGRGGSGGNSGGSGNNNYSGQSPDLPPQVMQWSQTIEQNLTTYIAIGIAIICLIWIVVIFLSTVGRIGLIHGASLADGGAESLIFGELFSESLPYFWRIFWLSVIIALPVLIVVAALVAVVVASAASASGGNNSGMAPLLATMPILIGCFCLLIPVMIVVGMIIRQAERAIVLEDLSVLPALSRGWEVFRSNLGPIILMAVILFVIGMVVGLVIAIPVFIIVIPAVIALAASGTQSSTPLIFIGVCFCLYIPVALVLNGVVTAYVESVWTLTYLRLTKPQNNAPVILEANA
jgi:hypothetical protein